MRACISGSELFLLQGEVQDLVMSADLASEIINGCKGGEIQKVSGEESS